MYNLRKKPRNEQLYQAILSLQTVEECKMFFDDLCAMTELAAIEQRFQVASYLDDGLVYTDILDKTGASSATISRVSRALQYGHGGFRIVFDRIKEDRA